MTFTKKIVILGLGGQGVLLAGKILAHAAFLDGFHSSFVPTYGLEVHNGAVKSEIIISEQEIFNPFIDKSDIVVIFHQFRFPEAKAFMEKSSKVICKDFIPSENIEPEIITINTEDLTSQLEERFQNTYIIGMITNLLGCLLDKSIGEALKSLLYQKNYAIIAQNYKAYKLGAKHHQDIH